MRLKPSLALGLLLGFLTACSGQNGHSGASGRVDTPPVVSDEPFFSLMQRANNILSQQGYQHVASGKGAFIVAEAPFEYWHWMAVLFDTQGKAYALQQRFVRLRLSGSAAESDSKWQFSEMMASDYRLSIQDSESADTHSQVQRVALELAGANSVEQTVWVGAYGVTAHEAGHRDLLKNGFLHSDTQNRTENSITPTHCSESYELSLPQITATFNASACSEIESTKQFSIKAGAAMPVVAAYKVGDDLVDLTGHGWFIHGWGVAPLVNDSAVLIDRTWLLLNEQQDVQLLRTRRRSGRGQAITSGSVRAVRLPQKVVAVNAQWHDTGDTQSLRVDGAGSHLQRASWELQIAARPDVPAIDLTLVPLHASVISSGFNALPQMHAVLIQGSHSGAGFVDIRFQ